MSEPPAETGHVETSLLSEAEFIQPGKPFWVGIQLRMRDGWHTYWKNPGDSGMATEVRWDLPAGFTAGPLQWPSPEKFKDSAGVTYGYKDEALLRAKITPPSHLAPNQEISLSAEIRWLECKDICVPGKAKHNLTLPVKASLVKK